MIQVYYLPDSPSTYPTLIFWEESDGAAIMIMHDKDDDVYSLHRDTSFDESDLQSNAIELPISGEELFDLFEKRALNLNSE